MTSAPTRPSSPSSLSGMRTPAVAQALDERAAQRVEIGDEPVLANDVAPHRARGCARCPGPRRPRARAAAPAVRCSIAEKDPGVARASPSMKKYASRPAPSRHRLVDEHVPCVALVAQRDADEMDCRHGAPRIPRRSPRCGRCSRSPSRTRRTPSPDRPRKCCRGTRRCGAPRCAPAPSREGAPRFAGAGAGADARVAAHRRVSLRSAS